MASHDKARLSGVAPHDSQADHDQALYEVRKKIYPRAVSGRFANWRWSLVFATQIIFYNNVLSTGFIAIPTLIIWRTPDLREFLFLLAIGALTTVSINCFIRGFAVGETSVVAPMEYARIIYATIIGFIVFGELPDGWTGVGALIIIGSTLYIARRETRARKAAREAAP